MERVLVVTDSSTCIPADLATKFGINVLPISVRQGDEDLGLDLDDEGASWQLPEAVEREELLGANHPFVTEYLAAIESPDHDAAVVVTPAIEFAAMYRNAALAAELANRPTATIDARTAAAGQALVVLAGAEAALRGAGLDEVVAVIEGASRHVELVASLATLEPIRRSGPVPEDLLEASELTGARSVFRMHDGNIESLGTATSPEETLELIASVYASSSSYGVERSTVFHAGVPDLAKHLEQLVGGVDFVSGFSIAMQVHTGRGVVGLAWLPAAPSPG